MRIFSNSFILMVMMALLWGCEKIDSLPEENDDDVFCDVKEPLQDIDWLKQRVERQKNSRTKAEIYKAIYDNIEGFIIDDCHECPDAITYFYDCQGNVLCEFGGIMGINTCPDFSEKVTGRELIWKNYLTFYWDQTKCSDLWGTGENDSNAETRSAVTEYLQDKNVEVKGINIYNESDLDPNCESCGCGTGQRIIVNVNKGDREKMEELGFHEK